MFPFPIYQWSQSAHGRAGSWSPRKSFLPAMCENRPTKHVLRSIERRLVVSLRLRIMARSSKNDVQPVCLCNARYRTNDLREGLTGISDIFLSALKASVFCSRFCSWSIRCYARRVSFPMAAIFQVVEDPKKLSTKISWVGPKTY